MKLRPFLPATAPGGVSHSFLDNEDGTFRIVSSQDVGPALDRNKAMATHNDGYSPSRELRRVAFIPAMIRQKWLDEEGWDAYRPDIYGDKLVEKLNSSDWRYLRTAEGRVSYTNGRVR